VEHMDLIIVYQHTTFKAQSRES